MERQEQQTKQIQEPTASEDQTQATTAEADHEEPVTPTPLQRFRALLDSAQRSQNPVASRRELGRDKSKSSSASVSQRRSSRNTGKRWKNGSAAGRRSQSKKEEERREAEEHKRKAEFVMELIGNCEEATRLRGFAKAIEERTARSDFSDDEKGDIQQVVEWTREYADSLDPLSDLPEAIEEFVRPESKHGWLE